MDNFDFLKKIDSDLYDVISDAEKLYTSEFFEQCMGQTRRFGELMCKNILKNAGLESFDDMLATLKDKATSIPEKEFIDDLYFLKKQGNLSVHSAKVKQDGIAALECLQRAFEAAINYAVLYKKGSKNILKRHYDIDLLVTGKRGLKEKYEKQKSVKSTKPKEIQSYTMKPKAQNTKKSISIFWIFVAISSVLSLILMLIIFICSNPKF